MHPPKPGLQNVLCASARLSYLSAAHHALLPRRVYARAHAHAACRGALVTAAAVVTLHAPRGSRALPGRLHFRPAAVAARAEDGVVTVVVAGPDGALVARAGPKGDTPFCALPGSAGYAIVALAVSCEFLAAAAVDGRVAVWRALTDPAHVIFDTVSVSGDRVTDMKFVCGGLVIAWWSGRLVLYRLGAFEQERVVWTVDEVSVPKHVFGGFSGSFLVVKDGVVGMTTGRGDLVFVRLADGALWKETVGEYVKGFCEYDDKLFLVVDGKLVTREWISKEKLDKMKVPTSVKPGKSNADGEKDERKGDKPQIVASQQSK